MLFKIKFKIIPACLAINLPSVATHALWRRRTRGIFAPKMPLFSFPPTSSSCTKTGHNYLLLSHHPRRLTKPSAHWRLQSFASGSRDEINEFRICYQTPPKRTYKNVITSILRDCVAALTVYKRVCPHIEQGFLEWHFGARWLMIVSILDRIRCFRCFCLTEVKH